VNRSAILLASVVIAGAASAPVGAQSGARGGEWRTYGGDEGHTKYSPLDQITRENVGNLQIAWRWVSIDDDLRARAKASGDPALKYLSIATYLNESTPLMVRGVLYTATSYGQIAAIDARTGKTR
jgi:quinoprotein glucose dehydrogenase